MQAINYQETNKLIGKTIAKYRKQNGLTQEQLAELLNLGNENISRMERGLIMPNVARLIELAAIFNCSAADLLGGSSTRPSDYSRKIEYLLSDLSDEDCALLTDFIEKFVKRLKNNEIK